MTQEQIDAVILDFLKAYKAWADEDVPEDGMFDPVCGLCNNLNIYLRQQVGNVKERDSIKKYFKSMLGGKKYPFTSEEQYEDDTDSYSHHRNPDRMAWVADQIERMEK